MNVLTATSAAVIRPAEAVKLQHVTSIQNAEKSKVASLKVVATEFPASALSTSVINISKRSSALQLQSALGMSTDQLNSMIETSRKMQAIRNDASIPPEVKKRLLKPLEQTNKDAMLIADAKAEQEEKSKIIEASTEDSAAIREEGKAIAAAAEAKEAKLESSDATAPYVGTAAATNVGARALSPITASEPNEPSPTYSPSQPTVAVGKNIDTHV